MQPDPTTEHVTRARECVTHHDACYCRMKTLNDELTALRTERDRLLHENSGIVEEIHQAEERAERAEAEVERLKSECICSKECRASEHEYPPIEVDETLSELYAEVERMRPVVEAATALAESYAALASYPPEPDPVFNAKIDAVYEAVREMQDRAASNEQVAPWDGCPHTPEGYTCGECPVPASDKPIRLAASNEQEYWTKEEIDRMKAKGAEWHAYFNGSSNEQEDDA